MGKPPFLMEMAKGLPEDLSARDRTGTMFHGHHEADPRRKIRIGRSASRDSIS